MGDINAFVKVIMSGNIREVERMIENGQQQQHQQQ